MVLERPGQPLRAVELPVPQCGPDDVLLKVHACGVCRTDLHILDGELPDAKLPLILGHEIVGTVVARGTRAEHVSLGTRLGVPWLGRTCGHCRYCTSGRENLCDEALFTGYTRDGGYAEYVLADHRYCLTLPDFYADPEAAPLLCAGLIGFRALAAAGSASTVGLYGFGAAAHIIVQVARYQDRRAFAFTKPGDAAGQQFALELGAEWAGDSTQTPPEPMEAAILFAPVGALVPEALSHTVKGGTVVCAGIHMSDIPSFPYTLLWGERTVRSVANLTRSDGREFLDLAPRAGVHSEIETYPLEEATLALQRLRTGQVRGAAVLVMD